MNVSLKTVQRTLDCIPIEDEKREEIVERLTLLCGRSDISTQVLNEVINGMLEGVYQNDFWYAFEYMKYG